MCCCETVKILAPKRSGHGDTAAPGFTVVPSPPRRGAVVLPSWGTAAGHSIFPVNSVDPLADWGLGLLQDAPVKYTTPCCMVLSSKILTVALLSGGTDS